MKDSNRSLLAGTFFALLALPAAAASANLGESALVTAFEGAKLVLHATQWPKSFGAPPALAELGKAGKLPPVEQRLPQKPLVRAKAMRRLTT